MMGLRYYSVFWKDNLAMSPFQTQMINFVTIMSGSVLSTVLMPQVCAMIGESAAVGIIDCISAVF